MRRGRPPGTGIDDTEQLDAIHRLLSADLELKPTTAIRQIGITNESAIRRLRDKYRLMCEDAGVQHNAVRRPVERMIARPYEGAAPSSAPLRVSNRDPFQASAVTTAKCAPTTHKTARLRAANDGGEPKSRSEQSEDVRKRGGAMPTLSAAAEPSTGRPEPGAANAARSPQAPTDGPLPNLAVNLMATAFVASNFFALQQSMFWQAALSQVAVSRCPCRGQKG